MILIKSDLPFKRLELPALTAHKPCNPSIVATQNGYECTHRGSNYDLEQSPDYQFFYGSGRYGRADSQNYFSELTDDLELKSCDFIEDRHVRAEPYAADGIEDLRLFYWKGQRYVTGTALDHGAPRGTMLLARLENNRLLDWRTIQSPVNYHMEKNWMPRVTGNDLTFLYYPNPLQIFEYSAGKAQLIYGPRRESLDKYSGSSQVVQRGDTFFAVVHRRYKMRFYEHKVLEFSKDWQLIRESDEFMFESPQIEFCAGLAFKDDKITFSYGVMDKKAVLLQLNFPDLEKAIFKG